MFASRFEHEKISFLTFIWQRECFLKWYVKQKNMSTKIKWEKKQQPNTEKDGKKCAVATTKTAGCDTHINWYQCYVCVKWKRYVNCEQQNKENYYNDLNRRSKKKLTSASQTLILFQIGSRRARTFTILRRCDT